MERYFDQSSQVVLGQACEVLESAEHSFDRNALPVGSSELLRSVTLEFLVDSENAFDAFLLVSRVRNDRPRSLLEGCKEAVDYLTKYYRVRPMRVILNGRKVGNGDIAVYFQNKAYFTKRGLKKRTILHELYHHLAYVNGLDVPKTREERDANSYARDFLSQHSVRH